LEGRKRYPAAGSQTPAGPAFKSHVTLAFFKGALLKDPKGILSAGGGNKHNRSVKFASEDDVDEVALMAFVREAVRLNERGAKVARKPIVVTLPSDLRRGLAANGKARRFFDGLAPSYRRDFVEWLTEAKKLETRKRRLRQTIGKLAAGRRLNDEYR
jgi:uncharacterized protein YdeI (YjbR/CyaY-like superfamily)